MKSHAPVSTLRDPITSDCPPDPVAIVTGATQGIGFTIAKGLAADGYRVALVARTELDLQMAARDIVHSIFADSDTLVHWYPLDVACEELVRCAVQSVFEKWGRIDVLVNAAGVFLEDGIETTLEQTLRMLNTNFIGAMNFMRHTIPLMQASRRGHVINITSISATQPSAEWGVYAASKAAILALSKSNHKRLAPFGVRVSAISPGWVATKMSVGSHLSHNEMISPEDIFGAVRFLLNLSSCATVAELVIDCVNDL